MVTAGIVHHEIQALDSRNLLRAGVGIRDVEHHRRAADVAGHPLGSVGIDVGHHHRGTGSGEHSGNTLTDAGCTTGDEGCATRQVEQCSN